MRFRIFPVRVGLSILMTAGLIYAPRVAAQSAPDLSIVQVKMIGTEMVVLENTSGSSVDLNSYVLEYFGKAVPANLAVPDEIQPLAQTSTMLPAGQAMLLMGGPVSTCGAALIDNLSFSLGDTGGYLQLARTSLAGDSVNYTVLGRVNWTSSASGADIAGVPSAKNDPQAVWYHSFDDSLWHKAAINSCTPVMENIIPADMPTYVQWTQASSFPPATIVNLANESEDDAPVLPASDLSLNPPLLTELLPNPAGTGNDDTDEFVELYNPNLAGFDLSGFTLQTGAATKHSYVFPSGTVLAPQSFTALYSGDTGLTLSNTSGQADLLDPFGNILTQTDMYGTAKDGQAWAFANGKWYWTLQTTPNAANVIKQITTASKTTSKSSSSKKSAGSVKGASTASNSTVANAASNAAATVTPVPIHPYVLAAVAILAVGYGVYEYRHDMANAVHQFRRNRAARRAAGK